MNRPAPITLSLSLPQLPTVQRRQIERTIQRTYASWKRRFPRWVNSGFDEHFLLHDALPLLDQMLAGEQQADPVQLAQRWVASYVALPAHVKRAVSEVTPVAADFIVHLQIEYCGQANWQ